MPKAGDPNTIVNGLYAIGECACVSVHGANRLGTNSLLDLLVFGRAAGNHIVASKLKDQPWKSLPADAAEATTRAARRARELAPSGERTQDVANDIRTNMQTHCGVFRTERLLAEGVTKIMELASAPNRVAITDKSKVFNTARIEALELANLVEVAKATIVAAEAPHRVARRARARGLPRAQRRRMDAPLAVLFRRQPPRLQAGQPEADDGRDVPAEEAHVLTARPDHRSDRDSAIAASTR